MLQCAPRTTPEGGRPAPHAPSGQAPTTTRGVTWQANGRLQRPTGEGSRRSPSPRESLRGMDMQEESAPSSGRYRELREARGSAVVRGSWSVVKTAF